VAAAIDPPAPSVRKPFLPTFKEGTGAVVQVGETKCERPFRLERVHQ